MSPGIKAEFLLRYCTTVYQNVCAIKQGVELSSVLLLHIHSNAVPVCNCIHDAFPKVGSTSSSRWYQYITFLQNRDYMKTRNAVSSGACMNINLPQCKHCKNLFLQLRIHNFPTLGFASSSIMRMLLSSAPSIYLFIFPFFFGSSFLNFVAWFSSFSHAKAK